MAVYGFIPSTAMKRTGSRTVKEQSCTLQQIVSPMKTSSKPSFLTCCRPKTFKWSRTQDPNTVSVDQLEKLVGDHYNPKPTATVQRCLFNYSRIQLQGELVAEFAVLKKLLEYCGFTDAQLKEMLRDRLICRINNERWQKRLLTENAADYQKVLDVALSLEAAEKSVQDLWVGTKLNKMGSGNRHQPFKGSGQNQDDHNSRRRC